MAEMPKLYGASYSVYVRTVRLALLEKGVPYELIPVDVFAPGGPPPDYRRLQPFGRIPSFEHAGFHVYETGAIARYVDEAFPGPALQPLAVRDRARCNQIISIADHYVYPNLVWGLYVELVVRPAQGRPTDHARVATAHGLAGTCLQAMDDLLGDEEWLAGPALTLADLYAAPMFACFTQAAEARALLAEHPRLSAWWSRIRGRPSMRLSEPE